MTTNCWLSQVCSPSCVSVCWCAWGHAAQILPLLTTVWLMLVLSIETQTHIHTHCQLLYVGVWWCSSLRKMFRDIQSVHWRGQLTACWTSMTTAVYRMRFKHVVCIFGCINSYMFYMYACIYQLIYLFGFITFEIILIVIRYGMTTDWCGTLKSMRESRKSGSRHSTSGCQISSSTISASPWKERVCVCACACFKTTTNMTGNCSKISLKLPGFQLNSLQTMVSCLAVHHSLLLLKKSAHVLNLSLLLYVLCWAEEVHSLSFPCHRCLCVRVHMYATISEPYETNQWHSFILCICFYRTRHYNKLLFLVKY